MADLWLLSSFFLLVLILLTTAQASLNVTYNRCLSVNSPRQLEPCYDKNGRVPDPDCKTDCYCVDTCYCQYANLTVDGLDPHAVTFGWNLSKPGCVNYGVHRIVLSSPVGPVWESLVGCTHTDLVGECTSIDLVGECTSIEGPNSSDFACPGGHCQLSIPVKTAPCSGCIDYTLDLSRYHVRGVPPKGYVPALQETASFTLCSEKEVIPGAPRLGMQELAPAIMKPGSGLPGYLGISWNPVAGPCVAGYRVSWAILGTDNAYSHRTIQYADHMDLTADITDLKIKVVDVKCGYPKYSVSVQAITPKGRLGEAKVMTGDCSKDHFIN